MLRPGGRLAFLTIQPTPELSAADRRRAHRVGPVGVAVRTSYPSLLNTAGFVDIGEADLTADYLTTQKAWIESTEHHADAVREAMGEADYEERMRSRRESQAAIEGGLLSRFMYWAERP